MIPPQIKLGIAIAAVALVAVMGWALHSSIEKNGKLSSDLESAESQIEEMARQSEQDAKDAKKDRDADAAALAESRRLAEQRRQQAATLSAQLTEARTNADLSRCLDMRLPDTVRLP